MQAREERELLLEVAEVIPTSILQNLRNVVDCIGVGRWLKGAGWKTARTYEDSSVGERDRYGIPTAVVHLWPDGPLIRARIVDCRTTEPLADEKMPTCP